MSQNDKSSPSPHYSWSNDLFDSQILSVNVAKIDSIERSSDIANLITDLENNKIDYATYRVKSDNFQIIQALEKNGFILVDGLISLVKEGLKKEDIEDSKIFIAKKEEGSQLVKLAGEVFFLNRLYNDSFISPQKASAFYQKWMENSLKKTVADEVFVYREAGKVFGFITLKNNGHIPLLGVSKEKRGKGIAKMLVRQALTAFYVLNLDKAYIETQISNIAALRVYTALGFKIIDSHLTFSWHKNG
jgi:dTDP-4-amino-4,6-dideoxy-D-galactose acyltransferase